MGAPVVPIVPVPVSKVVAMILQIGRIRGNNLTGIDLRVGRGIVYASVSTLVTLIYLINRDKDSVGCQDDLSSCPVLVGGIQLPGVRIHAHDRGDGPPLLIGQATTQQHARPHQQET
jgi:hypothetical protein